ncbi:MAG TPA: type IV pilin protein [Thiothrix sp.]|nr:type IV pilin protein [Thiothrix sp.]
MKTILTLRKHTTQPRHHHQISQHVYQSFQQKKYNQRKQLFSRGSVLGFTLIEIMIVMAIIGILAAVSFPSYVQHVIKSKRSDAHTALFTIAQQQEHYFVQNMVYAPDFQTLYNAGSAVANMPSPEGEYSITLAACADPCQTYTLTATPVAGKSQARDRTCVSLSISHLGEKTALDNNSVDSSNRCW